MRHAAAGRIMLSGVCAGVNRAVVLFVCWLAMIPLCGAQQGRDEVLERAVQLLDSGK